MYFCAPCVSNDCSLASIPSQTLMVSELDTLGEFGNLSVVIWLGDSVMHGTRLINSSSGICSLDASLAFHCKRA